jgi:PAS domain S-box-containing protein
LLCVEVMAVVIRLSPLTQGLLRFFPYCAFVLTFVHYGRLVTKPDRKNLLMMLFLASVFIIFLLDVTQRLDRFKGIPILGPDSRVRTDVKSVCEMVALLCFFIGSYFTLAENSQARARLQQEMVKLRRAEAALRESEERFRSLIENAADLIAIVREDRVLVYVSPSSKRVLGYAPEELVGRDIFEFTHLDDRNQIVAALRRAAQRSDVSKTEQCRIRHKDNTWRLVEGVGRLMPANSNGRNHLVVNLRDVTEEKRLEELLRQAQKMEAVGQLAGGVAHDFNNILTAILMHLGLLQQDPDLAPEIKVSLQEIEMGVKRAANLTRQLLLFSRRERTGGNEP